MLYKCAHTCSYSKSNIKLVTNVHSRVLSFQTEYKAEKLFISNADPAISIGVVLLK